MRRSAVSCPGTHGLPNAAFVLQQLMAQGWECAAPLYLAFTDLRKAFDSVPRDAMWRVLGAYSVPPLLVEVLSDLHTGAQAAVRLGALKGEPLSICFLWCPSGVRYCPLVV